MAHPYHHALSSVKNWGGTVDDYIDLHSWLDVIWTSKSSEHVRCLKRQR